MENDKLFKAFSISKLVLKQINGDIIAAEKKALDEWLDASEANRKLYSELLDKERQSHNHLSITDRKTEDAYQRVMGRVSHTKQVPLFRKYRVAIAAAAILLISSVVFTVYKLQQQSIVNESVVVNDVMPGSNKAVLTLSNGQQINLSDAQNGSLAKQTGINIIKTADGQLIYEIQKTENKVDGASSFNTITTPNGGQYQVRLPDGTKVWLNAASSLKYPISFSRNERRVELSGEAYFQVAVNKALPFFVKTARQEVKVLGTHFNVNSYADEEKSTTTLEEGSVKVTSKQESAIIKPGQQTITGLKGNIEVKVANLNTDLAWKNGLIKFKDADIKSIMRQVSRWYNIQVEYKGEVSKELFTGGVSRNENLSALLKILELNDVHFTIIEQAEGKKLIVEP